MAASLKVFSLLLFSLIASSFAQEPDSPGPSGFEDPCAGQLGVTVGTSPNLNCDISSVGLFCLTSSTQLCDNVADCNALQPGNQNDEMAGQVNALACSGVNQGQTPGTYRCQSNGLTIPFDELCNGVNDCNPDVGGVRQSGGDDETGPLCENKCRAPYYGNCPYSRECSSSSTVNCGICRPGWARDATDPGGVGPCLEAFFTFALAGFQQFENMGPLVGQLRLDIPNGDGRLDRDIEILVTGTPRTGAGGASGGDFNSAFTATVTFEFNSAGGDTRDFSIPLINDGLCEGTEMFDLEAEIVGNLGNFSAGGDMAVGTILDDDECVVGFQQPTYTCMEGSACTGTELVCLSVTGGTLTQDCSIQSTLQESNAGQIPAGKAAASLGASPPDATLNPDPTQLTFTAGQTVQCLNVFINSDSVTEGGEVFQAIANTLSPAVCTVDPAASQAQVCIQGEEIEIAFVQTAYDVLENAILVQAELELRAGFLTSDVQIMVNSQDGTASSTMDYTAISNRIVTFSAGSTVGTTQPVQVFITNDNVFEELPNEAFTLVATSTNPDVMFPSGNMATVRIQDDDIPRFDFVQLNYELAENSGTSQLMVRLNDAELEGTILVRVQDTIGTATRPDYNAVDEFISFVAGDTPGTTRPFSVAIVDDDFVEGSEMFTLQLSILTGTDPASEVVTGRGEATVTITDNDVCEIGFMPVDYTIAEANVIIQEQVCLVKMNDAILVDPVTVTVSTFPLAGNADKDSAVAGSDYTGINTPITFQAGTQMMCVDIDILSDPTVEDDEFFGVQAVSADTSQLQVVGQSATVCITDEDFIQLRFQPNPVTVNEGDGTAEVCVEVVSGSAPGSITVQLDTSDGTAMGADYTAGPYFVTLSPVSMGTSDCANIPITNDVLVELTESFTVTGVPTPANPDVIFPSGNMATVSIIDNDDPIFRFVQLVYSANEDQGTVQVEVELIDRELTFPISVQVIDIAGGTATVGPGNDYQDVLATLDFAAGDTPGARRSFDVTIFDDLLDEPLETILLEGSVNGNRGSFAQNPATVQINDDDVCLVGIEQRTYVGTELEDPSIEVCLEKTNNVVLTQDVDIILTTGPATPGPDKDPATLSGQGADINPIAGTTVTITTGTNRWCFNIDIVDDMVDERTENFIVTAISNEQQSIDLQPGEESAEICIQDNDLIVFQFTNITYITREGQVPFVQACIELVEGVLTRDVPVDVVSDDIGSAAENVDYTPIDVELIFPAGSMPGNEECFDLPIFDDLVTENTESYRLRATSSDPEAEFTPNRDVANVDIIDNDRVPIRIVPNPDLGVPDFTIPEGDGPLEVCVEIYNVFGQDILEKTVTVVLTTADGTAISVVPADYGSIMQNFVFNPSNQNSMLCTDIQIFDDPICEGDETFTITLTAGDPNGDCVDVRPPEQGTVTIIDDDVATIGPDQGIVHYNVTERIDDAVWIPLRLIGMKGPGRECRVDVSTMDGTAESPMDYDSYMNTLVFDANNDFITFHIPINDDTLCEGHEYFFVYLNSPDDDGCNITENRLTVWIWDDEVHFGDDPHFSIALPGGNLLCYTVQGEHGFSFNLINNERIVMNSKFVPDARRSEVTWLGSMGIIVQDSKYKGSNSTKLRFESSDKSIHIGDKIALQAKNIEKITFSNGKLTISEAPPATNFRYPSVMVDLKDVEISFTIKFTNQHLDMYWHNTGKKITDSHGLIGQFFREGVEIDEIRKILIMPNKEPVPVMRRPVWAFMEREEKDDQLCWTAMNAGYQGEGLIDGTYFDYLVDDVMSTDFKYNKL